MTNHVRKKALQVLSVMLSEEGQNALAKGEDIISYSQNVELELSPYLDDLIPLIKQNHMYIRIASNDFFAVSKDVVSKMILGEYNAKQAYEAFDAQLKQTKDSSEDIVFLWIADIPIYSIRMAVMNPIPLGQILCVDFMTVMCLSHPHTALWVPFLRLIIPRKWRVI